jgi:ABC-type lipoprotein export system ATPase subunit
MGASGAGKTTLLNILACRVIPEKNGKLYANNL